MSGVHDKIALGALAVLPRDAQRLFRPWIEDLRKSSWYPDNFADKNMSAKAKRKIDPEADRYIYPAPGRQKWIQELIRMSKKDYFCDAKPAEQVHLIGYYLENAFKSLRAGDIKSAVKYCGVYSHVIADTGEPVHAINAQLIDRLVPPPKRYVGFELHANTEGLYAPVRIKGYKPTLLGNNLRQVEMRAYAGLVKAHQFGAALIVPIVQALYAGKRKTAVQLSSMAQSCSAKLFADFLFSVYHIYKNGEKEGGHSLDLRSYPWLNCEIDMLYRYQPLVDVSLMPYSGGKFKPLGLSIGTGGRIKRVQGLGVVPFLGPPLDSPLKREASVEYLLFPGAFNAFHAFAGLNPFFDKSSIPVEFAVFGDNRELFRSGPIGLKDKAVEIRVSVKGIRRLKLAMFYLRGPKSMEIQRFAKFGWISHGVWGYPVLDYVKGRQFP